MKKLKEANRGGKEALPTRMFASNDQCSGILGMHFGTDKGRAANKRNLLLLLRVKEAQKC